MTGLRNIFCTLALCLIAGIPGAAQSTQTQTLLSRYMGQEPLRSSVVGVYAVRGLQTLASLNPDTKLTPASNTKLITTGLALQRLGPEFRFGTTLSYSGEIRDGVLYGDLYLVGGGDPTTGSQSKCAEPLEATFEAFKSMLDYAGITRIEGQVIGDGRLLSRPSFDSSWEFDDLGYYYGAAPEGLNFFENAQNFSVTSGEIGQAPSVVPTYPDTPWMSWSVSAVTAEKNSANTLYYMNTEMQPIGEFAGSFPSIAGSYKHEGSNRFGALTCAYYFSKYLTANGIPVTGGYADLTPRGYIRTASKGGFEYSSVAAPDSLTFLGTRLSPPLRDIVTDTNCESDNFYAETIFATLGLQLGGTSDRAMVARAEENLLAAMGLNVAGGCRLQDGSGLSRKNYVSARFFVQFLTRMLNGKVRDAFISSLPTPGGEGTLKYRMRTAPDEIKARIRMKSGSMNGVRCYSGYILPATDENGLLPADWPSQTIIFSILTNNASGSASTVAAILDDIIFTLAQEE